MQNFAYLIKHGTIIPPNHTRAMNKAIREKFNVCSDAELIAIMDALDKNIPLATMELLNLQLKYAILTDMIIEREQLNRQRGENANRQTIRVSQAKSRRIRKNK